MTMAKVTTNKNGKRMYGVELSAKEGDKVYAMDSGTVLNSKSIYTSKCNFGNYVQIISTINDKEYIQTYIHLKDLNVKKGDRVYKGQVIGTVGKNNKTNPLLFISLAIKGSKYNYAVLINNFIGRKFSYGNINLKSYKYFQSYMNDNVLGKYNMYCNPIFMNKSK